MKIREDESLKFLYSSNLGHIVLTYRLTTTKNTIKKKMILMKGSSLSTCQNSKGQKK